MAGNSIPHAVRSLARKFGPKPLYVDAMSGVEVNRIEFKNLAWAAARGLIDSGVQPGDGVALAGFEGYEGLAFELGCQAAGAVPFLLPAGLDAEGLVAALLISRCSRFVISDRAPDSARAIREALAPLADITVELPVEVMRRAVSDDAVIPDDDRDDPLVEERLRSIGHVLPAAGFPHVTPDGRSMVVGLSHSNILSMVTTFTTELMADESDTWSCPGPAFLAFEHLACWYAALLSGGTFSAAPVDRTPVEKLFLARPSIAVCDHQTTIAIEAGMRSEIAQIAGIRGRLTSWGFDRCRTRLIDCREPSGAADSIADLAVERGVREIVGGSLRTIVSDGPDVSIEVRASLAAAGTDIWAVLASVSASCFLAVSRGGSMRPGSVGRPLPGTSVFPGPDGMLRFQGPMIMAGEMGQPVDHSPDLLDRMLLSGYRGRVDADGFIYIDAGTQ